MNFSQNVLVVINFLAKRERIFLIVNLFHILCFPTPLSLRFKPVNPPACLRFDPVFELGFVFTSFGFILRRDLQAKVKKILKNLLRQRLHFHVAEKGGDRF